MVPQTRILYVLLLVLVWGGNAFALEGATALSSIGDFWKPSRSMNSEALLRESYAKATAVLAGARFDDIRRVFADSGNLTYTTSDGSYCEVTLRRDVTFSERGPAHELIVAVMKNRNGGASCLEVLLRGVVNKTITEVSERQFYPKGSLVAEILNLKHLRDKSRKAPLLVRVEIAFSEIEEPGSTQTAHGFTVRVQLSDKIGESPWAGTANVTYRALSGLDPLIDRATDAITKPTGGLFATTVLPGKHAITQPKRMPAIWVSTESE